MLFNSVSFAIFFPIVTILYFTLPYIYRNTFLLLASCFFYMFFKPIYILILFFTICMDYYAGIMIENAPDYRKKFFLVLSLVANLGVLALFKYYNFINSNLTAIFHITGSVNPLPYLSILLPIGLSFHTFQAMSYTIEIYRGNQKAERNFVTYALYVMFFPQLVAGPIERPGNLLHQFYERHDIDPSLVMSGLRLILWGLFKKVVIADRMALLVNAVYGHPAGQNGLTYLIAALFFAMQIYFDFSGYTDIARGAARVLGFRLMINFNHPFFACKLSDYWRCWHISLYSWFNDYLYKPLAIHFRKWGIWAIVISVLITFIASGLWHGAAWTFVVWGFMHGLGLSVETLTRRPFKPIRKLLGDFWYNNLTRVITLAFLVCTFVVFRAGSILDAYKILASIATNTLLSIINYEHGIHVLNGLGSNNIFAILFIYIGAVLCLFAEYMFGVSKFKNIFYSYVILRWATYGALLYAIFYLGSYTGMQFIYFQF